MKKTLIRSTILSLTILILISGIFSYIRIKNTLINEAYADITESLDGYIYLLENKPDTDLNTSSKDFGKYSGNRITVIDSETGEVLGDSFNDVSSMDNHLYREEISEALRYSEGSSVRHSKTENVDFIYYARYLEIGSNKLVIRASTPLYNIRDSYNSIASSMILAIFISAVIAFLISYRYNRKVIQPIESITKFARSISNGNYGKSVYINSYEEVTRLSVALNKLSKSLKKSFDKISTKNAQLEAILQSLNQGILVCNINGKVQYTNDTFLKIVKMDGELISKNIYHNIFDENLYDILEEIKDSEEDRLITKNNVQFSDDTYRNYSGCFIKDNEGTKKGILLVVEDVTNIRKLERMRSVFVSNVTHELKTPITCISGYTQTLLNGAIEDKENAYKFLNIINDESERLNLLIDDILTLSGLENQNKPVFTTKVNLIKIAKEVIELIQQKYPEKSNIAMKVEYDKDTDYTMLGDRNKLKQILINLVDNSIKHTEEGSVSIEFKKDNSSITMSVTDTGIGIDKKHHSRLFERFYRVDKHRSRDTGGTGLGLSIVKHLAIMHDGKISIESALGKGTKIDIKFPI
ncbi:MAG: ATP-binding protein [Eubacteriales bacterium]